MRGPIDRAKGASKGLCKAQVHQTTGRIIDEDEQGAMWAAILEPPVFRAVDLNQLAHTVATMPWCVFQPIVITDSRRS